MRRALKAILTGCARIGVAPVAFPVRWLAPLDHRHLFFQLGSQAMSLLPGIVGIYLRREYYKIVLGLGSRGFVIEFGTILNQRGIEIGNHVYMGPFCNVGLSTIEDDVLLGSNVDIVSGKRTHHFDRLDVPIREQGGVLKKIRIGKGAWIGNKSVVLESVGDGCVVGAGSVVTSECEPWVVFAGNPARPIRPREQPATVTG
jgi:acetyltransferase-like isoleucine patch superfamily enzyme